MSDTIALTDQWNDFLIRQHDSYALTKYEILLSWMGKLQGKSALVIGCGSGEFCALLAQRGAQVTATDIDEKNVALARETAAKFNTTFESIVSSIESMATDKQYDFVVATDVIEHIEDDRMAIKKLRRLVKPKGRLVMTVPALQSLFGYHDEVLGHFRRYSKTTLENVLKPEFTPEKLRYFGFSFIPVTLVTSRLLRKPYPVAALAKAKEKTPFMGKALDMLFNFEKKYNPGLGTSLLVVAKPTTSKR